MAETNSGERVLSVGPNHARATLRGGPRDGEIVESFGYSLPSELRYPAHGDSANGDRRYTLRGTSASGYWYEFTGTVGASADAELGAALRAALAAIRNDDRLTIDKFFDGYEVRTALCGAADLPEENDATRALSALLTRASSQETKT